MSTLHISGTIYDEFDAVLPKVKVEVYQKTLRQEYPLKNAITDANGNYTINIPKGKTKEGRNALDLFIRVFVIDGPTSKHLGDSPIYYNITEDLVIDYKIGGKPYRGQADVSVNLKSIQPIVEAEELKITDLKEDKNNNDFTILSGQTGLAKTKIEHIATGHQLSESIKGKIHPDIFYGLAQMGFPTDLQALSLTTSESIKKGITAAVEQNIISSKWVGEIGVVQEQLNQLGQDYMLGGELEGSAAFKKMMSVALPDLKKQEVFLKTYFEHEAQPDKFWDILIEKNKFSDQEVEQIKHVFRLKIFTGSEDLAKALYLEKNSDAELSEIRGFAKYNLQNWENLIHRMVSKGELTKFPEGIEGDTIETKTAAYAQTMFNVSNLLYPTTSFSFRIKEDNESPFKAQKEELNTFFIKNPDFDLRKGNFKFQLEKANFEGVNNIDATKDKLLVINRLEKLSPKLGSDYPTVKTLFEAGIDSATQLVRNYGEREFVSMMSEKMDEEAAETIYQKALQIDNRSMALALKIKSDGDNRIYAINGTNQPNNDYQSMFGDNQFCDCEHCQSVYSPSAYLVDLLNFLEKNDTETYTKFIERRPDIIDILLTCQNAHTPLPYIDLVNEVLEGFISGDIIAHQTSLSAEELVAFPEHTNPAAYRVLKEVNTSNQLPLDLPVEESRLYLEALQFDRYKLMELFFNKREISPFEDISIAAEHLGFPSFELLTVNGSIPTSSQFTEMVKPILERTDLDYKEFLTLIECYFVNPLISDSGDRSFKIEADIVDIEKESQICNIEYLYLPGFEENQMSVMLRFLRLSKKLGWHFYDLDQVFRWVEKVFKQTEAIPFQRASDEQYNQFLIIPLSQILRIKEILSLEVPTILSFWNDFENMPYRDFYQNDHPHLPNLYETLFLNKKVSNPIDEDLLKVFQNQPPDSKLSEKSALLISALNLNQSDLDLLLNQVIVGDELNLQNLSILFRYAKFSRAIALPVESLLDLIELLGVNPFEHPKAALVFIEKVKLLHSLNLSLGVLKQILIRENEVLSRVPNLQKMAKDLQAIREGLKIINLEPVPGQEEEQRALELMSVQKQLITDILGTSFQITTDLTRLLLEVLIQNPNTNTPIINTFLDEEFIDSEGPIFTIDESDEIIGFTQIVAAYELLHHNWEYLDQLFRRLNLSDEEFTYFFQNSDRFEIQGIWNLPGSQQLSDRINKLEKLLQLLRLRDAIIQPSTEWYNLFNPVIENHNNSLSEFIAGIATITQSNPSDWEFLLRKAGNTDNGYLNLNFPEDFFKGKHLFQALECVRNAQVLGTSTEKLADLAAYEITSNESQLAKGLLKAKYDEKTWLKIIHPISNNLRNRRRDALVSFILTDPTQERFKNHNSLFEHFLIDTEMEPCMKTSRIKQAISSVQLFVDRCLMGLEEELSIDPGLANQWKQWRKWYRIWEANRKIFLHPENWLEPAFREDKSPFFRELESKLIQNEVTAEIAKEAILEYLKKLDQVANLAIIAFFNETETNIFHVIGRTKTVPYLYFYRKRENKIWTSWEKIELDINSDHLGLIKYQGRLVLFWGIFEEKQRNSTSGVSLEIRQHGDNQKIESQAPTTFLEMKLAWSELKNQRWEPRKMTNEVIRVENYRFPLTFIRRTIKGLKENLNYLFLSSNYLQNRLIINLWQKEETINGKVIGSYIFENPNDKPVFTKQYKNLTVQIPENMDFAKMHLTNPQSKTLKIHTDGVHKKFIPSQEVNYEKILGSSPNEFTVLPNYYAIQRETSIAFFYQTANESFLVNKHRGFTLTIPDDELAFESKSTISRKNRIPKSFNIANAEQSSNNPSETFLNREHFQSSLNSSNIQINLRENTHQNSTVVNRFERPTYSFVGFYHPFVDEYIKILNFEGIHSLYNSSIQSLELNGFQASYHPTSYVKEPYPKAMVDFSSSGTYSLYNWELFVHIPLLIASRLNQNKKFEEARNWFHFLFNPTIAAKDQKDYWIPKPFKWEIDNQIKNIEEILTDSEEEAELELQIENWAVNPFEPHAVARFRIVAYMRSTVMKYIDNIIDWGDHLFNKDTIESINEATQLYILAGNLLGKKPYNIPARKRPQEVSYSTIKGQYAGNDFIFAMKESESLLPPPNSYSSMDQDNEPLIPIFCIPKNQKLLKYWDTVADRLFKIRNCMNIEGEVRSLPLYEPPIDPLLLVKAKSLGLDINTILDALQVPLPNYRFQIILQNANLLCNDVKAFGSQLLSNLEKGDAEELSLIRSTQEQKLLDLIRQIKENQILEARETINSLQSSKAIAELKKNYFNNKEFMNNAELLSFQSNNLGIVLRGAQSIAKTAAATAYTFPDLKTGSPFTFGFIYGGHSIGKQIEAAGDSLAGIAMINELIGSIASTLGGYQRRKEDWDFQAKTAEIELKQIDKQILAAEIRLAIAEKDLENHDLQIENAKTIDEFLKNKFTNEELYAHMVDQVSSIYFQTYQLAYEMSKKAERCYQFELGIDHSTFIQFGYWNSLKKGLLSGEKLQFDLRRLEAAYLENNKRDFEITKHISLASMAPLALIQLKETGTCNLEIPEFLFDLDHPGQYMRRIKSISITIPCITGPYTNVSCKLTLNSSKIRKDKNIDIGYPENIDNQENEDKRFYNNWGKTKSIATSSAQNDGGLFELNFRDERYLPFEGAGVISQWKLELPNEFRQFDYQTITDVVFHISYMAKEGGNDLKDAAIAEINKILKDNNKGLIRFFSAKNDFSSAWHRFFNPKSNVSEQMLEFDLQKENFPILVKSKNIELNTATVFLKLKDGYDYIDNNPFTFDMKFEDIVAFPSITLNEGGSSVDGLPFANIFENDAQQIGKWQLTVSETQLSNLPEELTKTVTIEGEEKLRLNSEAFENLFILFSYSIV